MTNNLLGLLRRRPSPGLAILGCLLLTPVATAQAPDRLDRFDLLRFRDGDGGVSTAVTSAQWRDRRASIIRGMHEVMGAVPSDERRVPLDVKVLEEADAGTYVRRRITYASEPGSRTPAFLCIPKAALKGKRLAPAALCLHPTDHRVGHRVVVGLGGRKGRAYAAELAERGYVTLSPSYPRMANYQPDLDALGYASGTMKAIWDNRRGLDLLASMPEVDDSRGFAAIGHSLGGHNAIFTAALEPRIKVIVSSCGFDSFLDYYDGNESRWRPGEGWCQNRYMPRLARYRGQLEAIPFDFSELLGVLAPRKVFINAPLHDGNFQAESVDRCVAAARPVYKLLGGEGRLVVRHPDCDHNFPKNLRDEAYAFIDSVLQPEESSRP